MDVIKRSEPHRVLGPLLTVEDLPNEAPATVAMYVVDDLVPLDSDWEYISLVKHPNREYTEPWWVEEGGDVYVFDGSPADLVDYVNERAAEWRILR